MSNVRKAACVALFMSMITSVAIAQTGPPRNLAKDREEALSRVGAQTLVPNEINMIEWRRDLMGRPGLQFYVVFFNNMGQPVDYFVTQGKCSSSNKRLTRNWQFERGQTGVNSKSESVYGDFVLEAPDLDGTHGQSDHYVFCLTSDGKYKQWNGRYYLSNAPIELTIKPLVIDTNGKSGQQQ